MRAVVLVIDSFGIGALPDAASYGDDGSNTAGHICEALDRDLWPSLREMGLGNAAEILGHKLRGCSAVEKPSASFGVMAELSPGKDTTTGHWELMGVVLDEAFRTFPRDFPSFPKDLTNAFKKRIGRSILANCAASGTEIIQDFGDEHVRSGSPILYTSSDSVFQIAAHEEVIPLQDLYRMCETARELCDPYRIGRVIARPFVGGNGSYTRTASRKDFSMVPDGETLLDRLVASDVETIGVGKIGDIFSERGIATSYHDKGNAACIDRTVEVLNATSRDDQFIFVNLVDTDMIYGHRRDVVGYADAVSAIDDRLPQLLELLAHDDLLVVTADHGCDPTFRGTDHTREYVPLLAFRQNGAVEALGVRESFSDLSQTLCGLFGCGIMTTGVSFF